jgi:hypothetical protein
MEIYNVNLDNKYLYKIILNYWDHDYVLQIIINNVLFVNISNSIYIKNKYCNKKIKIWVCHGTRGKSETWIFSLIFLTCIGIVNK